MIQRCTNPKNNCWEWYGGRGITVCERWRSFENFLADMGERPPGMTLDRIDPNGNYEPGNCRWATWHEQRLNHRPVSRSARLNHWEVVQIRWCLSDGGMRPVAVGKLFGVSKEVIYGIQHRKYWKHVP